MMVKVEAIDLNRLGGEPNHARVAGGSVNRPYLIWFVFAVLIVDLTACATVSRHQFVEPTRDWQARSGQLLYHTQKTTLIGEVLVWFSKDGDFELTFTKGPGVTLIMVRQDATFARVEGPLARGRWAGPVEQAPRRFRGWLALRNVLMQTQKPALKHSIGSETFVFQF